MQVEWQTQQVYVMKDITAVVAREPNCTFWNLRPEDLAQKASIVPLVLLPLLRVLKAPSQIA